MNSTNNKDNNDYKPKHKLSIAYSPCPNDTFVFHALCHGLIPGAPELDVTYADIDITNGLAANGTGPDVLKISYAALPWALKDYALLPCGGALGRGCGPLVLIRPESALTNAPSSSGASSGSASLAGSTALPPTPASLAGRRVAVPSERSTAYLLFRLWAAQNVPGDALEIVVLPFHEIMPAVRDGLVDAGLVIHEARFTYPGYGLQMMADLGQWWESDTGLPIPLGAIIARRTLDTATLARQIRASVEYAWARPDASRDYVMAHAQEMDPAVARQHIELYVNAFTADLGEDGYAAVNALLGRAMREGLVPTFDLALLQP